MFDLIPGGYPLRLQKQIFLRSLSVLFLSKSVRFDTWWVPAPPSETNISEIFECSLSEKKVIFLEHFEHLPLILDSSLTKICHFPGFPRSPDVRILTQEQSSNLGGVAFFLPLGGSNQRSNPFTGT